MYCRGCDLDKVNEWKADNPLKAFVTRVVANAKQHALFVSHSNPPRLRDTPRYFDYEHLADDLMELISRPDVIRCKLSGTTIKGVNGVHQMLSLDEKQLPWGEFAGYGLRPHTFISPFPDKFPNITMIPSRPVAFVWNVSQVDGLIPSQQDVYDVMCSYRERAVFHLAAAVQSFCETGSTGNDEFDLRFRVLLGDATLVKELLGRHAAYDAESVIAAANVRGWVDSASPNYDAAFHEMMCVAIRTVKKSDKLQLPELDHSHLTFDDDFKDAFVEQGGRCTISGQVHAKTGQHRPSPNRIERDPGHTPPNVRWDVRVCNGVGNAIAVKDDVLTGPWLRDMVRDSIFLQLSWLERLALDFEEWLEASAM